MGGLKQGQQRSLNGLDWKRYSVVVEGQGTWDELSAG